MPEIGMSFANVIIGGTYRVCHKAILARLPLKEKNHGFQFDKSVIAYLLYYAWESS